MPPEPSSKRAIAFVDSQNLFYAAKYAFGYSFSKIRIASAFPVSPTYSNARGVNKTDWIRFDRALYDRCQDRTDYRKGIKG